ncbi:MAG TPA: hypothetical protein PKM65_06885 [Spirochaetota bacterium]|nr:hypothetical protein [Spirochaetota bacterium]HNT09917.1 hypothetical protein [Spirochaetota bacterium]HNV45874.1 hypothetical protein [Spirochaetota bacterium]HOS38568.1 hypothetical protein [Spirochaetota bacterium]HPI24024.1 hypothetical protein [Spirochaetota bacterium]
MGVQDGYTPREALEISSSLLYVVMLCVITCVASLFQVFAQVSPAGIVFPFALNLGAIALASVIHSRKKARRDSELLQWGVALLTITAPVLAKYNYARTFDWTPAGWTFAAQSYNSSILLVVFVVLLQLLYNRRLFICCALYAFAHWIAFFVIAYANGAALYFYALSNDAPRLDGVIVLREVFYIFCVVVIAIVAYRNIASAPGHDGARE